MLHPIAMLLFFCTLLTPFFLWAAFMAFAIFGVSTFCAGFSVDPIYVVLRMDQLPEIIIGKPLKAFCPTNAK